MTIIYANVGKTGNLAQSLLLYIQKTRFCRKSPSRFFHNPRSDRAMPKIRLSANSANFCIFAENEIARDPFLCILPAAGERISCGDSCVRPDGEAPAAAQLGISLCAGWSARCEQARAMSSLGLNGERSFLTGICRVTASPILTVRNSGQSPVSFSVSMRIRSVPRPSFLLLLHTKI